MDISSTIQYWYNTNKRKLPWRQSSNPYNVWLSEIILQQTKVNQGLSYYNKFIDKYPKLEDLAMATEDDVLKLWQGLGYYSRARNMHYTAKDIVFNHNSVFPKNYTEIIQLKGVGDYTASAIASICFNEPVAVVDGNVYRVLARIFNIQTPIDTSEGRKLFRDLANAILDKQNPGNHNQALMEFGALVCKPKNPNCNNCSLLSKCISYSKNNYSVLPVKSKK